MRSKSWSLRVPWPLDDAMKQACKAQGYQNLHACGIGAFIKFVQDNRRQQWIPSIANSPPKLQDFLLEKMLSFPIEDVTAMVRELKKLDK